MQEEEIFLPDGLAERLLAWYDKERRILPWREQPTPYYVWVSEIMLQQTRVEAVKPYFERFIRELPDVFALANAEESLLMKLWEGLGYYRRVKNLQAAAKRIVKEYGGEMPRSYAMVRELPGIGDYTAGAICSIAFGLPTPAVDGNVLRVLSRVCEDDRDILKQPIKRDMNRKLAAIYPRGRCGDFTQSLMELGAMVCVPNGTPHCEVCPLEDICLAHLRGSTDELPVKTPQKPRKIEKKTVFLLYRDGKVAVKKREEGGLLAGLWEYPNCEGELSAVDAKTYLESLGMIAEKIMALPKATHIFTHIEWQMKVYAVTCNAVENQGFTWATEEQLQAEIPLPTAFRKIKKTKNP